MPIHEDPEVDDLIERWQRDRDERARDKLYAKYEKWFLWVAHRWAPRYKLNVDDAVQAARIGFGVALDKYEAEHGRRITTYSQWWMRRELSIASSELRAVRAPANVLSADVPKLARAKRALALEGIPLTEQALAERLGWTLQRVGLVSSSATVHVSLDAPLGSDSRKETTGLDLLEADEASRPDLIVAEQIDSEHIADAIEIALGELDEREKVVFQMRFREEKTLEEIGQRLDLTRERVRQLRDRIIAKMQSALRCDARIRELVPDREVEEEQRRLKRFLASLPKPTPTPSGLRPRT